MGQALGARGSTTFAGSPVLGRTGRGGAEVAERISGLPGCGQPGVGARESGPQDTWQKCHQVLEKAACFSAPPSMIEQN